MFSFKSYKRKCLIRLMTVLGFGGMVGFCIASCQSRLEQKEAERVMHEVTKYGIVEPTSQLQLLEVNPNQQPEQESPEKVDSVQPETQTETQADNPSPTKPDTVEDEQQITDSIPNDTKMTDEDDNTEFRIEPSKYGIPYLRERPPKPTDKLSPSEVKQSLIELNRTIQSTCHPEEGTLTVSFTVQNSGKIVNVKSIDGTLKGSKSEKCILDQISKYRFREFEGSDIKSVKYQFEFE